MDQTAKTTRHHSAMNSFKETLESLIIAFILAFVFRAFTVEAFIIPTGSMADTLRGAHFRLTCRTCGYPFNLGYGNSDNENIPFQPININPSGPRERLRHSDTPICPICGTQLAANHTQRVSNGDRILVLKYLYFLSEPDIWDVVVFKNPVKPEQNFIKRLIGRPGDTIEIIDGDVYIDGIIQRKPAHVQDVLWIPVYHSDYQSPPDAPGRRASDIWDSPFEALNQPSAWNIDEQQHRFEFQGSDDNDELSFKKSRIEKFSQSFLAYNGNYFNDIHIASDLKIDFVLTPDSQEGKVVVKFGKYNRIYRAEVEFNGACRIIDESAELTGEPTLKEQKFPSLTPGEPIAVSFANVDHTLRLCLGEHALEYTGENEPEKWGYNRNSRSRSHYPSAALAGQGGGFSLKHVVLYRDVHYTNSSNGDIGAGTEGNRFTLEKDEFFVLGDNSPQSHDSRFWEEPKPLPTGKQYRANTVPRDYLIGRAFFVYWPAGFHIHPNVPFAPIPNIGDMRFIH